MRKMAVVAAVCAIAGCETKELAPRVMGTKLAGGSPSQVWVSPEGSWAAALVDVAPAKDPGAPQDLLLGSLVVAPVAGGAERRLGGSVSNLPGNLLFSKNGAWLAFVADFSVKRGSGELRLAKAAGGDAESLANEVTFYTFSVASDLLAYVANGELFVRVLATGETVDVTSAVSLAEFAPNGARLLVKRRLTAGGALLAWDVATRKLTALARGVGTFAWSTAPGFDAFAFDAKGLIAPTDLEPESPFVARKYVDAPGLYVVEGSGAARRVSEDVPNDVRFAPAGQRLAYVTAPKGGANFGDLWVADLPGAPREIAKKVQGFQISAEGSVAALGSFDSSATGKLDLLAAGETTPIQVAHNVKVLPQSPRAFGFTPKGKWLLFHHVQTLGGTYSLVLGAWRVGQPKDEAPRWVDTGAFGYVMNDDEERLAYKARCIDQGRACSLFVQDLSKPAPGVLKAEGLTNMVPVVARIAAFEWLPGRDELAIITSRRGAKLSGTLLFALDVIEARPNGRATVLDDQISGDFQFAGADRRTAVYAATEKGREGLYRVALASAPAPAAGGEGAGK